MLRRNPFVPEVAVDLEYLLYAADGEALEIELWRHAHEEPHVQRVVMRHERARERAAGDGLHHRRFDLEESAPDEELANRRDDPASHLEHASRVGIDDQVEIPLAVADFDVLQPVPFLWQREQALGEKLQRRCPDRQLVRACPEQAAFDADPVTQIKQLENLEVPLAESLLLDIYLHARAAIGNDKEVGLPEAADRKNPSRGADVSLRGLELLRGTVAMLGHDRIGRRVGLEAVGIRIDAELLELLEIGAPLNDLIGFLECVHSRVNVRRTASSTPLMNRTESSVLKVRASSSASLMITFAGVSGS